MKKIKLEFIEKNSFQNIIIMLLGIILVYIIGRNIPNLCTVWELGDEAGYIGNAAYFTGHDWGDIWSTMAYYSYGYSILLIPAFWICKTGVEVIQSACIINVMCILGIYIILIYLMGRIYPKKNKIFYAFIAFTTCLNPYTISNALKVFSESFLSFFYMLITFILYKALKTENYIYHIFLGVFSSYIFFIHTRAFVITLTVYFTLFFISIIFKNNKLLKKTLLSLLFTVISFILFYLIKQSVLNVLNIFHIKSGHEVSDANLITSNYLADRLKWLLGNRSFEIYSLAFCIKLFYIAVTSGVMAIIGFIQLIKSIIRYYFENKKNTSCSAEFVLKCFFGLSFIFMLVICTISGAGITNNFAYYFYGRYYEFTIIPLVCVGIFECINFKVSKLLYIEIGGGICILGLISLHLNDWLDSSEIHLDTNRIDGLSKIIENNDNYMSMVLYGTLIIYVLIFLYIITSKYQNLICILIVCSYFIGISQKNIDIVMEVNSKSKDDAKLAEYIINNLEQNNLKQSKVYMIDDKSYKYDGFYSRMQVLIKDEKLNVITSDDYFNIKEGDFILLYSVSALNEEYLKENKLIGKGNVFNLYQK